MPRIRANGIEFEYDAFGRDGDPVILLIMGYAAQMTLWPESLCRGLAARGFRVIRFDNRDIGKSTHLLHKGAPVARDLIAKVMAGEAVQVPYTLEDMAADAAGLLDALGIARAHIVGASMGGMIAQLVAIRHANKVKSLVSIMSTTARRGLPQAKSEAMAALVAVPPDLERETLVKNAINIWRVIGNPGFSVTDSELRAKAEHEVDRTPLEPTGLARQMAAIIAAQPRHELLKSVRAPALVIHGADDPLIPVEAGKDTAASIPGAELVVIPGAGHTFSESIVPVYLEHMGAFFARVEARS